MSTHVDAARQNWTYMEKELLAAFPELIDDDQTLFDTLDGMTDLTDQIAELMRSSNTDADYVEAINNRIDTLRARGQRLARRADKKRDICLSTMAHTGIKKIQVFDMTISRRRVNPKVMIIQEDQIPDKFFKEIVTHKLLKADLKTALDAGEEIPGAVLGNVSETLSVRTK